MHEVLFSHLEFPVQGDNSDNTKEMKMYVVTSHQNFFKTFIDHSNINKCGRLC